MQKTLITTNGLTIEYQDIPLDYQGAISPLVEQLNTQRGALFASSFEYPGRYTCWDVGFYNPPVSMTVKHHEIILDALNQRGIWLLAKLNPLFSNLDFCKIITDSDEKITLNIIPSTKVFSEEMRSQQPSVFSIIRLIRDYFSIKDESYLGLYGAFGYDLVFEFEYADMHKNRSANQRDLVLYLPDELWIVNHRKETAFIRRYDFFDEASSTKTMPREGKTHPFTLGQATPIQPEYPKGEYAKRVDIAKEAFAKGDLFEVVPSQTFTLGCPLQPSELFETMRSVNPSPYGFLINLGEGEFLVGASPEMYVRVNGSRVETCPISGTIKRGKDAIEDAKNIQQLLDSEKEASELTMCTDVDRNDKSRICEPGSVKVLGRRQIELYSRVIHTVDHVEGQLRHEFDAIDAFLTHMWVVTVTGAPKVWAMNFIERHEKTPRRWYGGSVGWFTFDGNLNSGLVLRTARLQNGMAEIRVGATLLYDSIPEAEEEETHLKASAFIDMIQGKSAPKINDTPNIISKIDKHLLLIDHQDSFVHTLANYFRQTGVKVTTVRFDHALDFLASQAFDGVILSPGPGCPSDFNCSTVIDIIVQKGYPIFGVCLGLQAIVEFFGGTLDQLTYPMHGKPSSIYITQSTSIFNHIESPFIAGRYHSLHAKASNLPDCLNITAKTNDDIIMAISHKTLPIHAVQFHPETILSLHQRVGMTIVENFVENVILKQPQQMSK